jgi:hypothetical protein
MSRREGIVKSAGWLGDFSEIVIHDRLRPFRPALRTVACGQTAFDELAAVSDFGPLRFSRNAANMALARAGKSR